MGRISIYNTVTAQHETITANGKLKYIFPEIDFRNSLCLKAGHRLDRNYEVQPEDVLYVRKIPGAATTVAIIAVTVAVVAVGVGVGAAIYADQKSREAQAEMEKAQRNAQNLAQQVQQLPFIRGAKNKNALGNPVQFVMGSVYNTPYNLTNGFYSIQNGEGQNDDGKYSFYNAVFSAGYGPQKITEILVGNEKIASNNSGISGAVNFDSDSLYYDSEIENKVEVQQPGSAMTIAGFNQKVSSTYAMSELKHEFGEDAVPVIVQAADNAMKIQVCIQFNSLRKYNTSAETWEKCSVEVNPYWSNDGGTTWNRFDFTGAETKVISGVTHYNVIERNSNHTIRFVAEKTFTAAESYGKTISIKVEKTTPKMESNSQEDCALLWYQTFCYDADLSSSSSLVACQVVNTQLLNKTTRVAYRIVSNDNTQGMLDELHCMSEGFARTWNGSEWSNTKTSTRNLASWILEVLTSDIHNPSKYDLSDIDLPSFGALYEYCADNDFYCDGILDKEISKKNLIEKLLTICNSSLIINQEGKLEVITDKEETTPVALLNAENIASVSYSKNLQRKTTGTKVTFTSRESWTVDTFYSMLDGGSYDYQTDTVNELALDYVTEYNHAYKIAQRQLRQQQLQPREIKVDVGSEGDYYPLYSTILLQIPQLLQGLCSSVISKVYYNDDNEITGFDIQDLVQFEANKRYGIILQGTNDYGYRLFSLEVTGQNRTRTLALTEPLTVTASSPKPEAGNHLSFGLLDSDGEFTKITNTMKIYGIEPNQNKGITLTLKDYNEDIYEYGTIPNYKSNITLPQAKDGGVSLDDIENLRHALTDGFQSLQYGDDTIGNPDNVTGLSAVAKRDGISLKWNPVAGTGLANTIKQYNIEISKDSGTTWTSLVSVFDSSYEYVFDRSSSADGYPEASDFSTWQFRVEAESVYGKHSAAWTTLTSIDTSEYKTWIIPEITVDTEVSDRLAVLTAVYNGEVYGTIETLLKIKRLGNTDLVDTTRSYNDLLCVYPDGQFYTPDFDHFTGRITTNDDFLNYGNTEENYRLDTTDAYVSRGNKITHTLPLIGQNPRMFKMGEIPIVKKQSVTPIGTENPQQMKWYELVSGEYVLSTDTTVDEEKTYYKNVPYFVWEVSDSATEPSSPSVGDMFHYTGETNQQFTNGFYYLYNSNSEWEQIFAKSLMAPTIFVYQIQMKNEASESNVVTKTIQALPTNIADIVHSHEHYKDLYVEKLSAISANIGLIQQGGFGEFDLNKGNYWALSTLTAEDTGISGGIEKGSFRVGGTNEYFRVTPLGNDNYRIELKAGNIELTTESDEGMDFFNGTYVYDSPKTQRMALTPTGIRVEKYTAETVTPTGTENPSQEGWYEFSNGKYILTTDTTIQSGKTYYINPDWYMLGKVSIDPNNNLIISNTNDNPEFGFKVNGTIYHFEDSAHKEDAESGSNTMGIVVTGDIIPSDNSMIDTDSSKNVVQGTVEKDVSQFSSRVVFFTKANGVQLDRYVNIDGTTTDTPDTYNSTMFEAKGQGTVGSYLGLTSTQISNGIFEEIEE